MMNYSVISFYKYIAIPYPEGLRDYLKILCQDHQLLGRILLAKEGINGAVSGKKEDIQAFQKALSQNPFLLDLSYREQETDKNAYHKLVVRVRPEIVSFGTNVNPEERGAYLEPQELKNWYDQQEQFVIIDARNDYEFDVGKFKNAVKMPIKKFREFPKAAQNLTEYKNQKVVLYCTGGIRCEKASAYLKQNGFDNVYHIKGGIINYVNQFPQTYWEGGLFVFDDRLVAEVETPYTSCSFCNQRTSQYTNCHNLDCDRLFLSCQSCLQKMENCCSAKCQTAPRKRKSLQQDQQETEKICLGIVENYYARKNIAAIRLTRAIQKNIIIRIEGKTTASFTQEIAELRTDNGQLVPTATEGELITIPIIEKVRKNDKILLETSTSEA